ncbi:MAG: hypothetical protein JW932_11720 [Deltaproteobacteria bacterium]|nr:hypothetical protein [Deltaproteobacteria bacterium]
MENLAISSKSFESMPDARAQTPQFHSIEFSIDGLEFAYQFKLWNIDSEAMNIIIKEDSALINKIRTGNRFISKYYSDDMSCPVMQMDTEISRITKADGGKFKGHYIVGLSVTNGKNEITTH